MGLGTTIMRVPNGGRVGHKILETRKCGDGMTLTLVFDRHAAATGDASRLFWWLVSPEQPDGRRVTALDAIELMTAELRRPFRLGGGVTDKDLRIEAAQSILNASLLWIATPVVSPAPDYGGPLRPFWKEIVEAIGEYPDAAARSLYDLLRSSLKKSGNQGLGA